MAINRLVFILLDTASDEVVVLVASSYQVDHVGVVVPGVAVREDGPVNA